MPRVLFAGNLLADYFQIYLCDAQHRDLPNDYSDRSIANRLIAGPYGVIVHTARNMTTPVSVEWSPQYPAPYLDAYQHVVEAGFGCPSRRLILAGLTDYEKTAPRLDVEADFVAVRANFSGLDTLRNNDLDGDDRVHLQLWPGGGASGVRVLKAWRPQGR